MPSADQRFREKLAARKEGRAPVITAPVSSIKSADPDARHRAKLASRAVPAVVATKPDAKPEVAAGTAPVDSAAAELAALEEATKPDAKPEGSPRRPGR